MVSFNGDKKWIELHNNNNNKLLHTLVTEEVTRDVQFFTTNNNDFLAFQQLFGNNGSQTAEQVTFTVNNDNLSFGGIYVSDLCLVGFNFLGGRGDLIEMWVGGVAWIELNWIECDPSKW